MKTIVVGALLILAVTLVLSGCATAPSGKAAPALRVGVTADYPPLIYKEGGKVTGVEADLARRLGEALGRPVQFVELAWDDLIPALLDRRIDIIMSGMSVTDTRKVRIAFSDAYMRNSLVAAIERTDEASYRTREDILACHRGVGVLRGSSAEAFVSRNMPAADKRGVDKISDVKLFFAGNRIRIFIGDVCAVAWLVSENETELAGVWIPLQDELLAWGFRGEDAALRESVNRTLAGWKRDGTLKSVLSARVPYLDRLPWAAPEP